KRPNTPKAPRVAGGADRGGGGEPLALVRAEAVPGIPDQVAHAAKRVMDERPSVAKQNEPSDDRAGEPFELGVAGGARRSSQEPPGHNDHAEIERHAGDAMDDG